MTENFAGERGVPGVPRSRLNDSAWGFALFNALVVIVLFQALQIIYTVLPGAAPQPVEFVPEVVTAQGVTKYPELRPQVQAYASGVVLLVATGAFTLFGPVGMVGRLRAGMSTIGRHGRRSLILLLLIGIAAEVLERRKIGSGLFDMIGESSIALAIAALVIVILIRWAGVFEHRIAVIMSGVVGIYIVAIGAAGFVRTPSLAAQGYQSYTMIQFHYTAVMGTADQIGHGLRLWKDVTPYYGILASAILGAWIKFVSGVSWAAHYRIAQILSVAMIVSVPATLLLAKRELPARIFGSLVLPTLFVVPFLYSRVPHDVVPQSDGLAFHRPVRRARDCCGDLNASAAPRAGLAQGSWRGSKCFTAPSLD